MKTLPVEWIAASLCIIAYVHHIYSRTDQKIVALIGKVVIYQSVEGGSLAGIILQQSGGEMTLSALLRNDEEVLCVDPPESVREATIEEKRQVVTELGLKRASWTLPIWIYRGRQWNLRSDL